jgi:CBS domain-containing protein
MSVGRVCVRAVDTAEPEESITAAARRMHDRAVGTLVVVDHYNRVVGIVTDRDLVSRVLAVGLRPAETTVREAMTCAPSTVSEDTPIEYALAMMRSGKFRRIPVVDESNKLQGLITLDDVLMLLAEEFTQVGRLLNRETPRAIVEDQQVYTSARS